MADTLPKTRVFHRLSDRRATSTKQLALFELLDPTTQRTQLGREPLTRSQVMSRELQDPSQIGFATFYTSALADRTVRRLRVVDAVVDPPPPPPQGYGEVALPDQPHAAPDQVGRPVGIPRAEGSPLYGVVVDVSLDLDLASGTTMKGRVVRFLVEVPDPIQAQGATGRGDLALLIVERATEVVKQDLKVKWLVQTVASGGVPVEYGNKVKVKGISDVRNWGSAVALIPIDNTVNARLATTNLGGGIVKINEISDNHFSSDQAGKNGAIVLEVRSTTAESGAPIRQYLLSWQPPEGTKPGATVDVSSATGGLECSFTLRCTVDAPDGSGGTFPKDVKIGILVNADLFPYEGASEAVVVSTTFQKTPDGRPILGVTSVPPDANLAVEPAWTLIDGHPDAPFIDQSAPSLSSGRKPLGNVDDQGLSYWHRVDRPVFAGRSYPTAVFERWYVVPTPSDLAAASESDQILQKESAALDHSFDIWIVALPMKELVAFLKQTGALRPFSTEPTGPDEKVYPYKEATPQDLRVNPPTLMADKLLGQLDKVYGFVPPIGEIPWIRRTDQLYYIFVVRVDDRAEMTVDPTRRFRGQSRFDLGPLDPPASIVEFPVATHVSGTGEADTGLEPEDPGPPSGIPIPHPVEPARVATKLPGQTQSLLVIYPRRYAPSKATGADDALKNLGQTCGGQPRDPLEEADLVAQVR